MTAHRPRKRFGQNFLHDRNVLNRVVSAADFQVGDRILEIGPGRGALTARLLESGLPVLAIEIDRDLATALQNEHHANMEVIVGDVLRLDWTTLLSHPPYKLVANLPYNISSQVLFRVLEFRHAFSCLVLMFQKEVGERLLATEGTRNYGIISVLMQVWFDIERVVKVPPQAFHPPPKVESVVLKMTPRSEPAVPVDNHGLFARVVKGAFAQRRKTLRNSLAGSGWETNVLDRMFELTAIDPKRRGETLKLNEFAAMANCLNNKLSGE